MKESVIPKYPNATVDVFWNILPNKIVLSMGIFKKIRKTKRVRTEEELN